MTDTTHVLENLTPTHEKLFDVVHDEYVANLIEPQDPTSPVDIAVAEAWAKIVYKIHKLDAPTDIRVVSSPWEAVKLANELCKRDVAAGKGFTGTDLCGMGDLGWVSSYDYFTRVCVPNDSNPYGVRLDQMLKLRERGALSPEESAWVDAQLAAASPASFMPVLPEPEAVDVLTLKAFGQRFWDTIALGPEHEGEPYCMIVVRRPTIIRINAQGRLHGSGQPCIEWADGHKEYCHNGVWVPERMVMNPTSYTKDELVGITRTEQRRALIEIAGWEWYGKTMGAEVIDTWTDPNTQLTYELMDVEGGGPKLLRKLSPKLMDGSQPLYVEPVHEDLRTAKAARKWQATDWTPEQCERDPTLVYGIER